MSAVPVFHRAIVFWRGAIGAGDEQRQKSVSMRIIIDLCFRVAETGIVFDEFWTVLGEDQSGIKTPL